MNEDDAQFGGTFRCFEKQGGDETFLTTDCIKSYAKPEEDLRLPRYRRPKLEERRMSVSC